MIRGLARSLAPIAILWAIYDWWLIGWVYGLIFGLLTINYVVIYVLTWLPSASGALRGPLRIRPWQTLLLVVNAVVLPIVFKRHFGVLPWGFIVITVLFFIGLYVATYILFYLQDRSPLAGISMPGGAGDKEHVSRVTDGPATQE